MVTISEDLIRKRAEHNDLQIGSLEEISLHQQDIIKIDNIQNWCKNLKILFLQSNVISRIENLWKLKNLEYLNLAVNNIEHIENLEQCESLKKLDLTLNFIGELTSVKSLENNYNLRELYLTGNPCWKFLKYRDYIIATLPQLETLDGISIRPSEKITTRQNYSEMEKEIESQQMEYIEKRRKQKQSISHNKEESVDISDQEKFSAFWNKTSEYTPETRLAMVEEARKIKKDTVVDIFDPRPKRKITLFKNDGCPLNVNEAKIPFTLQDDKDNIILTVDVYKHLDTSLLDVDVQPWFVRVMIKNKVLQLVLPEEVHPDRSKAQRAITSRKLIVTMAKDKGSIMKTEDSAENTSKQEV